MEAQKKNDEAIFTEKEISKLFQSVKYMKDIEKLCDECKNIYPQYILQTCEQDDGSNIYVCCNCFKNEQFKEFMAFINHKGQLYFKKKK
jgi:hypothetical protein